VRTWILAHLPTKEFHPIMLFKIHACSWIMTPIKNAKENQFSKLLQHNHESSSCRGRITIPSRIIDSAMRTPILISALAPMVTFGPILQLGCTEAEE
jgi:hypothetical protein